MPRIEKYHLGLIDGRWVEWEGDYGHLPVQYLETTDDEIVWTPVAYRHTALEDTPEDERTEFRAEVLRECTLCAAELTKTGRS